MKLELAADYVMGKYREIGKKARWGGFIFLQRGGEGWNEGR